MKSCTLNASLNMLGDIMKCKHDIKLNSMRDMEMYQMFGCPKCRYGELIKRGKRMKLVKEKSE